MIRKRYLRVPNHIAGCVSLVLFGWAVVVHAAPERNAPKKQPSDWPVVGRVVTEWGNGAIGHRAGMTGHDVTVLEREGRFSFAKAPAIYDVWVANKRGDTVVLYQGLTRRDPVIHFAHDYDSAQEAPPHRAAIRGILRGNFPFPTENGYMVTLAYLAGKTKAFSQFGQQLPYGGPRFGRWNVQWDGEPTLRGTLVALGQHGEKGKPWLEAFLASKSLSLVPGDDASLELKLTPVSIGRIAGVVDILHKDVVREIYFSYRLAKGLGEFGIGSCPVLKTYDCPLPNLTTLAGTYCAVVSINFPYGEATGKVTKCGGKLGMTDFSFHVGPPPKFKAPRENFTMTRESTLSWVDAEKGVYHVELMPDSRMAIKPTIEIFTAEKELRWPDLEGLGLKFPAGAQYRFRVSRLSPYASVDELVSGRGFPQNQDEVQEIASEPIEVTLAE
jgi:hypothetical protein